MLKPTLQNVKDFAAINMIPENIAESYWLNFECQDWVRANSQKITKWQVHFKWWYQAGCWKSKDAGKKTKLFPIKGKRCSEKNCGMPAVYKWTSDSSYDFWYCFEHIPKPIKKKVEKLYE